MARKQDWITYHRNEPQFPSLHFRSEALPPGMNMTELRATLRQPKPPALPAHCKPWLDAQRYPIEVRYPYNESLVMVTLPTGTVTTRSGPSTSGFRPFAQGHASFLMGYAFRTPPGVSLLVTAHPQAPVPALEGIIESSWYPMPPFLVFRASLPGTVVTFKPGQPLCLIYPVLEVEPDLREMHDDEAVTFLTEKEDYEHQRMSKRSLLWESDKGQWFSRLYKTISANRPRFKVK